MDVLGNLTLAGTVHVSSLGGYNPNDGDTFTIITFDDGVADATDLLGTFSSGDLDRASIPACPLPPSTSTTPSC